MSEPSLSITEQIALKTAFDAISKSRQDFEASQKMLAAIQQDIERAHPGYTFESSSRKLVLKPKPDAKK